MSINATRQRMHWLMILVCLFSLVFGSFVLPQSVPKAQAATVLGQWSIIPANAPAKTTLTAIAAVSSNDVWAAGIASNTIVMEHWNGITKTWSSSTPFPLSSTGSASPTAFAVITSSNIWMTGSIGGGSATKAFIAHWDGSSWKQAQTPDTGQFSYLQSIDALSATNIWAFGSSGSNKALIEHWDGLSWSIVSLPQNLQDKSLETFISSCKTPDGNLWIDAMAYGGDGWLIKKSGDVWSAISASVGNIACSSQNDVWIISILNSSSMSRYAGNTWQSVPSDQAQGSFRGIAALTSNDVWTVGYNPLTLPATTFIKHWDGTQFITVTSPSVSGMINTLNAVSALNPNDVWAVGSSEDSHYVSSALIEHYVYTPPPVPGGKWVTKTGFNVAVGKQYTFQVSAKPTNTATDPAIAHVNFTATWPGHGWVDICGNVTAHTAQNVYSCSTDFTKLNVTKSDGTIPVPEGSITVTFNVTDKNGNVNNAPNGSVSGKIVYSTNAKGDKAIAWAIGQMTKPSQNWVNLCETFVEHAYGMTKGAGGGGYLTAQDDANANLKHTTGTPDIGALVFFKYYNPKDKNWDGHVGIYLGGNLFISATDNNVQIYDKDYWATTYAHEPYEGWGDAPSSWPGK